MGNPMKFSSAIIFATAFIFSACASQSHKVAGGSLAPPSGNVQIADQGPNLTNEQIEKQLLDAVNSERAKNGLPPLALSLELNQTAQAHTDRMENGGFLSTRGPDESSVVVRMTSTGLRTMKIGENVIRLRTRTDRLAEETVAIWMGAPADRKNLLSTAFTKNGFGISRAADGDYYITEDFAQ
jgi:uncharacterized protein YkwD